MNGFPISTIVLMITFALTIFLWLVALLGSFSQNNRTVAKRVAKIRGKTNSVFSELNHKNDIRKKKLLDLASDSAKLRKNRLMNTIFNELLLSGVMMKPEEFSVLWLVCTFVPSGLVALFTRNLMSSLTLAVIGAFGPILFLKMKKKKRVQHFESQLGDALMVACNCLHSGLTFQQGMETIASDMSAPISTEFSRVLSEINLGSSMDNALNNLAKRINSSDLLMVVSAVNIQRQTGGNLSEILSNISETIKDRLKIKAEVRSVTAQGRMSGTIVGSLPIVISLILMLITPSYMTVFFTTNAGHIMLSIAAMMEVIGYLLIRKVVSVEY